MQYETLSVVSIVVICYLIGVAVQAMNLSEKLIPVVVGAAGIVLGLLSLHTGLAGFPASEPVGASAVGAASALVSLKILRHFKDDA